MLPRRQDGPRGRTRPCRRGRAGSSPRSHRRPGPVHVGRPAGAVSTSAARRSPWPRRDPGTPACLVLRHRRPSETQPLTVDDDREAAATASTSQSAGPTAARSDSPPDHGRGRQGPHDTPGAPAAGRDQGADLRVRSRRRRLGRQSRTRRARTLRPWRDAPTVTPTSSTYKVVSHPHVVNSMGATTNRFSPGDPQDRPQAQARRWRRCTARSAATPTPGSSTPAPPTTARASAVVGSARSAARGSPRSRPSTLTVTKRNGVTEPFSRDKVARGVRKACQGRPVTEDDLALLAQRVEEGVRAHRRAPRSPATRSASRSSGRCATSTRSPTCGSPASTARSTSLEDFEAEIALLRAETPAASSPSTPRSPSAHAAHRARPATARGTTTPDAQTHT